VGNGETDIQVGQANDCRSEPQYLLLEFTYGRLGGRGGAVGLHKVHLVPDSILQPQSNHNQSALVKWSFISHNFNRSLHRR
jgi:hypothetical protein